MADDKTKPGEPDRSRVSGSEDYEVHDFAEAAGITNDQARELIRQHGPDREKLMAAAARLTDHARA
ncbi:DUF3606 domain-containing protein [Flaviflagellibacter deserti]|uniref:DUF3606 domain-containing protein n=1 Tax=Flaviflagellibacter deserti TaxID=2267266 RepID=A0ABV9Z2N5_9HYPH